MSTTTKMEIGRLHHDDLPANERKRYVLTALWRGARLQCPHCGAGRLFRAYLKVADHCPACGEAMHHQRADDAPPYLTILVVGHVMIPVVLTVDLLYEWPMWLNIAVWFPILAGLALALLPITKGALVGLQWALRMHGFGGASAEVSPSSVAARPSGRRSGGALRPQSTM